MLTLGIYGDSFAHSKKNTRKSWIDYLQEHYDITNYGVDGSGVYWSYSKFLKTYKQFDFIIFLVTSCDRIHIKTKDLNSQWQHLHSANGCENWLNEKDQDGIPTVTDVMDRKIIKVVQDYMIYAQSREEAYEYAKLMVENIIRLKRELLIIPCFNLDWCYVPQYNGNLYDISLLDVDHYGGKDGYGIEQFGYDLRQCHLNDRNNEILANKIHSHINISMEQQSFTSLKLDRNDFTYPYNEPLSYNFTPRK